MVGQPDSSGESRAAARYLTTVASHAEALGATLTDLHGSEGVAHVGDSEPQSVDRRLAVVESRARAFEGALSASDCPAELADRDKELRAALQRLTDGASCARVALRDMQAERLGSATQTMLRATHQIVETGERMRRWARVRGDLA